MLEEYVNLGCDLSTRANGPVPNVVTIRRFHCISILLAACMHDPNMPFGMSGYVYSQSEFHPFGGGLCFDRHDIKAK